MTEDQKRALGIGAIGVVALLVVRSRSHATTTTVPVSTSGSVAPYTPQAPLPLPPGESVYDPNSQALLTTPTGFPPPPQTTAPAAPAYLVNVTYPSPVAKPPPPTKKKPAKRKPNPKRKPKAKH